MSCDVFMLLRDGKCIHHRYMNVYLWKSLIKELLTLKPAENFLELRVYTIWAHMATLGGVT